MFLQDKKLSLVPGYNKRVFVRALEYLSSWQLFGRLFFGAIVVPAVHFNKVPADRGLSYARFFDRLGHISSCTSGPLIMGISFRNQRALEALEKTGALKILEAHIVTSRGRMIMTQTASNKSKQFLKSVILTISFFLCFRLNRFIMMLKMKVALLLKWNHLYGYRYLPVYIQQQA